MRKIGDKMTYQGGLGWETVALSTDKAENKPNAAPEFSSRINQVIINKALA